MRKLLSSLLLTLAFMTVAVTGAIAGDNAILASLNEEGVIAQQMDDKALSEVRGTGLVYGMALPSYTAGLREYHVTYKQFGSQLDYRSYNIIGYSSTPGAAYTYGTDSTGRKLLLVGDTWLADTKSAANTWNRMNAVFAEDHFMVMGEVTPGSNSYSYTGYGYTDSYWNRPLSTFNW